MVWGPQAHDCEAVLGKRGITTEDNTLGSDSSCNTKENVGYQLAAHHEKCFRMHYCASWPYNREGNRRKNNTKWNTAFTTWQIWNYWYENDSTHRQQPTSKHDRYVDLKCCKILRSPEMINWRGRCSKTGGKTCQQKWKSRKAEKTIEHLRKGR